MAKTGLALPVWSVTIECVNISPQDLIVILTTAGVIVTAVISWLSARRTSVENIAKAATALIDPLRERIKELEAAHAQMEKQNIEYGRRIDELEEQNKAEAALRRTSERRASQLEAQIKLMETQRDLMQTSIDVLRNHVTALETQLRTLGLVPVTQQPTHRGKEQ